MCASKAHVAMGFTKESFPAGTHICLIYDREDERRKIIGKFLESGLTSGEKVEYFADMMTSEDVRDWLSGMGVALTENAGFEVRVAESVYSPQGQFVPEAMLGTLRAYYDRAMAEGYPAARVSGEMTWALKGIPGSDRLMEYEALVNGVLKTHPVTAICQYDAGRFDGATILDVLRVHPMMIVHGQIVQNPYYMSPEKFLRAYEAKE